MDYFVLWDNNLDFFYMQPGEPNFYIFTEPTLCKSIKENCTLKRFSLSKEDLYTALFNAGFSVGFIDGKPVKIRPEQVAFYNKNSNQLYLAQYQLTQDEMWIEHIETDKLFSLCKINGTEITFATVANSQTNEVMILVFSSKKNIPYELRERYHDFEIIKFPLTSPHIIDLKIPVRPENNEATLAGGE